MKTNILQVVRNFEDGLSLIEKWLRNKPNFNSLEFEENEDYRSLRQVMASQKALADKMAELE